MTGRLIESAADRAALAAKTRPLDANCLFCEIIAGRASCYKVYENEHIYAFLDILPLRSGHTLVVPKQHYARLNQMPDEVAARLGASLPLIARGIAKAMEQPDFNVQQNNGYAQVVDHVHFHIVPAPKLGEKSRASSIYPDGRKGELDEEEGNDVASKIAQAITEDTIYSKKAAL